MFTSLSGLVEKMQMEAAGGGDVQERIASDTKRTADGVRKWSARRPEGQTPRERIHPRLLVLVKKNNKRTIERNSEHAITRENEHERGCWRRRSGQRVLRDVRNLGLESRTAAAIARPPCGPRCRFMRAVR